MFEDMKQSLSIPNTYNTHDTAGIGYGYSYHASTIFYINVKCLIILKLFRDRSM